MPVRTRSASGRFEPAKVRDTPYNDPDLNFTIPRSWIFKVSYILILFILISPWIFLMMRKHSFTTITQKVTEFYDDNFSCNSKTASESIITTDKDKGKF
jgi:hypothetical protein